MHTAISHPIFSAHFVAFTVLAFDGVPAHSQINIDHGAGPYTYANDVWTPDYTPVDEALEYLLDRAQEEMLYWEAVERERFSEDMSNLVWEADESHPANDPYSFHPEGRASVNF